MTFAQIVLGFGGYSAMIIGYAILSDMCKDTMRQKAILSMNGVWYNFVMIQGFGVGIFRIFLQLLQPMVQLLNHHRLNPLHRFIHFLNLLPGLDANVPTNKKARQEGLYIISQNRGYIQQTERLTNKLSHSTNLTSSRNDPNAGSRRQEKQH